MENFLFSPTSFLSSLPPAFMCFCMAFRTSFIYFSHPSIHSFVHSLSLLRSEEESEVWRSQQSWKRRKVERDVSPIKAADSSVRNNFGNKFLNYFNARETKITKRFVHWKCRRCSIRGKYCNSRLLVGDLIKMRNWLVDTSNEAWGRRWSERIE